MQSGDVVAIGVENLRPGLLSEAETSDPSVVSKRRRLGPTDVGRMCSHTEEQQMLQRLATLSQPELLDVLAVDAGPAARSFSSKYRGVSWHNQTGKWKAQIKVSSMQYLLSVHHQSQCLKANAFTGPH